MFEGSRTRSASPTGAHRGGIRGHSRCQGHDTHCEHLPHSHTPGVVCVMHPRIMTGALLPARAARISGTVGTSLMFAICCVGPGARGGRGLRRRRRKWPRPVRFGLLGLEFGLVDFGRDGRGNVRRLWSRGRHGCHRGVGQWLSARWKNEKAKSDVRGSC